MNSLSWSPRLGLAAGIAAVLFALAPAAGAKPAWQLVYSEPNQGNVLVGLSAVDGSHAWAVGVSSSTGNSAPVGVLTTDGSTWSTMTLPPPSGGPMQITLYTAIDFSNPTQGWLNGVQAGIGGAHALLYATQTGGMAWAQVFQPTEPLTMIQALPSGELYGAGGVTLVVSTDGVTYGEVSPPVPGALGLTAVHMLNSGCGFLAAASASDAATAESAVLWSGDGGQSWEVRAQGLPARLGRMWFVTANLGWAAGTDAQGAGVVARTTDGGRTWTMAMLPDHPAIGAAGTPTPVSSCQDVRFFDDLRGVALCLACTANCDPGAQGDPSLLTVFARSSDGGLSWTMDPDYEPVMSAPPFGPLMKFSGMDAMAFPDPNGGFLAGQNNLVLRYAAVEAEPAAWGPPSCDPGAGGTGGSTGGGGNGASNGSADGDTATKSGCGCALPGTADTTPRAAILGLALTFLSAGAGRARRAARRACRASAARNPS